MRDHKEITQEEFNGLWRRGGPDPAQQDSCPPDHFPDCNNIQFIQSGFRTRDGIEPYLPYSDVIKIYNYPASGGDSVLVLDADGNIYHSDSPTPFVPILTIVGMTDFGVQILYGRAYISPCDGRQGLSGEFVYVYMGDGSVARKAAGTAPVDADGALAAANSGTAGNVEAGTRIYAVVYETDTGFLTAPGPDTLPVLTSVGGFKVDLTNVPVSPNSYVTKRHVLATKAIVGYNGDTRGYQFFFVPTSGGGDINDNTTTTAALSFFDSDLIDDASYLLDILDEIPAGVGLGTYHGRMLVYSFADDNSLMRVSVSGEPEAFNAIDGLIVTPQEASNLTGAGISNAQELRDVLYIFKDVRTYAVADNGDVPTSWQLVTLDQGLGAPIHGIAQVLDKGGLTIESLIIVNYSGIYIFNGNYNFPELSWKIADFWTGLNFSDFLNITTMNNTIQKIIYIILPDRQTMLTGDYKNALTPKEIRWAFWTFDIQITTICLTDFDHLLIGSQTEL